MKLRRALRDAGIAVALLASLYAVRAAEKDDSAHSVLCRGKVRANVLNVRARPGLLFEVVCRLRAGAEVEIVGSEGGWYEINAPSAAKAWVADRYLKDDSTVAADRLRVHAGPGLVFTTYGHLDRGDQVKITPDRRNGWVRIVPTPGITAWVSADHIDADVPPGAPESERGTVLPEEDATRDAEAVAVPDATRAGAPAQEGAETPVVDTATGEAAAPEAAPDPADETEAAPVETESETADDAAAAAPEAAPVETEPEIADDAGAAAPGDGTHKVEETLSGEESARPAPAEPGGGGDVSGDVSAPAPEDANAGEGAVGDGGSEDERGPLPLVVRDGYVLSLERESGPSATHMLASRVGNTLYPICYLVSATEYIDLTEWEYHRVKVYGQEVRYEGWRKPVLDVTGILRLLDEP